MTTLVPTLSTRYLSGFNERLRDAVLVIAGGLLVAMFAQVRIPLPFTPVPLTGQTFAVLLVGAALGSKRGSASLLLYLAMGALGLPFFAGGAGGLAYLSGPTLGYLAGFVAAAYVIGLLCERGLERSVRTSVVPFLAGTLVIYLFGVAWLSIVMGSFARAVAAGLLPFLAGDALKLVAAAVTLPAAWHGVGQRSNGST
jgi:biotin transport system substrate-specific component